MRRAISLRPAAPELRVVASAADSPCRLDVQLAQDRFGRETVPGRGSSPADRGCARSRQRPFQRQGIHFFQIPLLSLRSPGSQQGVGHEGAHGECTQHEHPRQHVAPWPCQGLVGCASAVSQQPCYDEAQQKADQEGEQQRYPVSGSILRPSSHYARRTDPYDWCLPVAGPRSLARPAKPNPAVAAAERRSASSARVGPQRPSARQSSRSQSGTHPSR